MDPRKLQYFFTKVMGLYHFFDGPGRKFFCSVNVPFIYGITEIKNRHWAEFIWNGATKYFIFQDNSLKQSLDSREADIQEAQH